MEFNRSYDTVFNKKWIFFSVLVVRLHNNPDLDLLKMDFNDQVQSYIIINHNISFNSQPFAVQSEGIAQRLKL